jgi:preprotein translocase subunit SecA
LKEYQKEGYNMFLDMSFRIKEETVRNLLRVKLASPENIEDLAPKEPEMLTSHSDSGGNLKRPAKKAEKIGRNEPCPCGSGKKYKKCCGKAS